MADWSVIPGIPHPALPGVLAFLGWVCGKATFSTALLEAVELSRAGWYVDPSEPASIVSSIRMRPDR